MGKSWKPNVYQHAIFDFIDNGKGNAVVESVAGSGKTTTIVQALERTGGKVLFCAFNKAIAQELRRKVPDHVDVKTVHSLGLSVARHNMPNMEIDVKRKKLRKLVRDELPAWNQRAQRALLERYVSLCKGCMLDGTEADVRYISQRYGVNAHESFENIAECVQHIFARCRNDDTWATVLDFDDMIWLAAVCLSDGSWCYPHTYDWVFVDEAQDLTKAQRLLVEHMIGPLGRCVAVGDSHQAIYGFRGADVDSMARLKSDLDACLLPLSVCYRCATSHIDFVRELNLVPSIEARPNAPEGAVYEVDIQGVANEACANDLVLCRKNAPLLSMAFLLLANGTRCKILGNDIGRGLVGLVTKLRDTDVKQLLKDLRAYVDSEVDRLIDQKLISQANRLEDQQCCIRIVARGLDDIDDLTAQITDLFSDKKEGVTLSSIHRAKGLEAIRVFVIHHEEMPMRWHGQAPWQLEQEHNLMYVAFTRAKRELYLA